MLNKGKVVLTSAFLLGSSLPLTFLSLECNACWFSKPDVTGTVPGIGVLGWGALCEVGIPHISGETSAAKLSLPISLSPYHVCRTCVELPPPVSTWLLNILSY